MPELSPMEARYLDKALDTMLALWSALLSIEGLLLAVAPIVAALAPRGAIWLSVLLVITSLLAGGLLVWNFVSVRETILKIGQILSERRPMSESDVPKADRLFHQVRTRERLALGLLLIQIILVLGVALKAAYQ